MQGNMIVVAGRASIQDDEEKIMVESIRPLSEFESGLVILLERKHEDPSILSKIKEIMQRFSGNDQTYLHFLDSGRKIKCAKEYWVNSNNQELINEVKNLLGKNNVKRL